MSPSMDDRLAAHLSTHSSYTIPNRPLHTPRHLKVITIGCGISGLQFAHDIKTSSLPITHTIYEKCPSIGGTWFTSRYPGIRCDVPSVAYQFLWHVWDKWTQFYPEGEEILTYLRETAERFGLLEGVKLGHKVRECRWDEGGKEWVVMVERMGKGGEGEERGEVFEDRADVVVDASGIFSTPRWPDIPGRETFKGTMVHTAQWPEGLDLTGKTVAMIGNGSTGVQITPQIQPVVKKLHSFIRSPSYILFNLAGGFAKNGQNFIFTEKQKDILANDPETYLKLRKAIESEMNSRFKFIQKGSQFQNMVQKMCKEDMARRLSRKPWLAQHLIPQTFGFGCRRPSPGNGYLEALCEDNVDVHVGTIPEITPTGIRDADGVEHEVDVIICATGFDTRRMRGYRCIGREGKELSEEWKENSLTYLGVAVPGWPNFLIFNGPYGPTAHGAYNAIAHFTSGHFLSILRKLCLEQNITSITPSIAATLDFHAHQRQLMSHTVWSEDCSSWFKQGTTDRPPMVWPGSRVHFLEVMAQGPRWEDWVIVHADDEGEGKGKEWKRKNRFAYLGNGFHVREIEEEGRDVSWYLPLIGKDGVWRDERVDIGMEEVVALTGKGADDEENE